MIPQLFHWFKPTPPTARLPPAEVDRLYPTYRWRVFEAAFMAYAMFCVVRNNFAPVSKEIGAALHYDKAMIGDILAVRRGRVSVIAMIPLLLAFGGILIVPAEMLWLDMLLFAVIGFFVYVPVMFSGVMSLDLTSKKLLGTAAGFVGFFGSAGGVIQGKGFGWISQHHGWYVALGSIVVCIVSAMVLLTFLWNVRPRG